MDCQRMALTICSIINVECERSNVIDVFEECCANDILVDNVTRVPERNYSTKVLITCYCSLHVSRRRCIRLR